MDNQNMNQAQAPVMDKANGSVGPIIGAIIILAVIILGGLYFWSQRQERSQNDAETARVLQSIQTQDSSDNTSAIEADLNNTDTESLDAGLQ